jgi:carboxymethylenebutenolidase
MRHQGYAACESRLTDASGRELPGYLGAAPAHPTGIVLVVHDFFGLTSHVKGLVRRFSAEAFVTFAVDLYRGRVAKSREEATVLAETAAASWKATAVEIGLGVAALRARHPGSKVGVLGFGMGGAAALVAAAAIDTLSAAVTFYGIPQDVTIESRRVKIQGHFCEHDQKCTARRVADLQRSLREREIEQDVHQYEAHSGFFNANRAEVHSAPDAALAWQRTLAFLSGALA